MSPMPARARRCQPDVPVWYPRGVVGLLNRQRSSARRSTQRSVRRVEFADSSSTVVTRMSERWSIQPLTVAVVDSVFAALSESLGSDSGSARLAAWLSVASASSRRPSLSLPGREARSCAGGTDPAALSDAAERRNAPRSTRWFEDWLPGAAAGSRRELDLFEAQMGTALRDKRGDHGLLVALCAREHRRLLAAVVVAPLLQADERDMKVAALAGQVVLVPLRPFLIANPLEDSLVDQPAKTLRQNLPRDPEISLELVEAS